MAGYIHVHDVHKRFRRDQHTRAQTFKEHFVRLLQGGGRSPYFWALQGIEVEVQPGEVLAVIGRNGSGKSTLLRLVGGIGRPERGQIERQGRMLSMLDLGLGFHPDLTGEENVYVSGVIYGLTRREIRERMASIVAFAEIGSFMGSPLRTYSAGMRLRLAFAVAAHCQPEILLIDEVLAVGDLAFQNKCLRRIAEFQASGCAILLVTHDVNQVRRIADRVLWLHQGKIRGYGLPAQVTDAYQAFMEADGHEAMTHIEQDDDVQSAPPRTKEIALGQVRLLNIQQHPITAIKGQSGCIIQVPYHCHAQVQEPRFLIAITREDGQKACHLHSSGPYAAPSPLPEHGLLSVHIERLDLSEGEYFIDVGVFEAGWSFAYDFRWRAQSLTITETLESDGVLSPPCTWAFEPA